MSWNTPGRRVLELMARHREGDGGGRVSPKLDGVYARATKDGVVSKSGKPLDVPHVDRRLRGHFRRRPDAALEGELYRKGAGVERVAGEVRRGGAAAKGVKLHLFPDQGKRPLPLGAVRRVRSRNAKDEDAVGRALRKSLRKGHEGVVVRGADGERRKKKPREDAEWEVAGAAGGPRNVLTLRDGGGTFKVQGRPGVKAKAGDRVTVSHSGKTAKGRPKAAVAERVRNDQDFMNTAKTIHLTPARRLGVIEFRKGMTEEEEIAHDRRKLAQIGAAGAGLGAATAGVIAKGRGPIRHKAEEARKKRVRKKARKLRKEGIISDVESGKKVSWAKRRSAGLLPKAPKVAKWARHLETPARRLGVLEFADQGGEAFGRRKRREDERDGLAKARDVAIIGAGTGVAAGGVGAGVAARRVGKKAEQGISQASSAVRRSAKQVRRDVTPDKVAREGLKLVKRKAKDKAVEYFPTFTKAGKVLRKTVFETPARRMGVMEFATTAKREQLRDVETRQWADPWKTASGVQRAGRMNASGDIVPEDLPIGNAQVIRSARNRAGKIQKWGGRGGRMARDAGDVVRGKPRQRDASGRRKQREWEKSWFKNEAGKAGVAAGLLGYGAAMKQSPKFREANVKAIQKGKGMVNQLIPDAFPDAARRVGKAFETPARRLGVIELSSPTDRRKREDAPAWTSAVGGGAGGGMAGALIGADLAKNSEAARAYQRETAKSTARRIGDSLTPAGDEWSRKKTAEPFGKGKLTKAEKVARAAHEKEAGAARGMRKAIKRGALKGGLAGAGVLGALNYVAAKGAQDAKKKKKDFTTPAQRLGVIEFDAVAADAGWDVRDPRGKSARVFAPGSRKRQRRPKKWHEKAENERKLRNAGTAAALIGGTLGGMVIGRRMPRKIKLPKLGDEAAAKVTPMRKKAE